MKTKSSCDVGTLMHLRNVINRRNIKSSPKDDVNAHEDFLQMIVESHILTAAMEFFGMETLQDDPSPHILPPSLNTHTKEEKNDILLSLCKALLSDHVNMSMFNVSNAEDDDKILAYANELLSLGLLYTEFVDSIREGDGLRVLRCWRFLMLIFKANNRRNYAIEAFIILAQQQFILSGRQSQQLLYSRFINTHGLPGKNISCDLYMEHLNRHLKDGLRALGANKTPNAIQRLARCIAPIEEMLSNFDSIMKVYKPSGMHKRLSADKDMAMVIKELQNGKVFQHTSGRKHSSFSNFDRATSSLKIEDVKKWMKYQWIRLLAGMI